MTPAPLLANLQTFASDNVEWIVAGVVVVIGLFVIGIRDVARFSPRRIWALSGVCFRDAVRRRVLWVAPIAILAVLIVSALQKPNDAQDSIRQTLKFCLFATGLVVTVTTVILACTNLPREIESRVIYTVVTKPTTRLEIVLGKIVGFARVSAMILVIMGLFSFAYLQFRASRLGGEVRDALGSGNLDPATANTLRHYSEVGLLSAQGLRDADALQVYSRPPKEGDAAQYMFGGGEQDFIVPFALMPSDLTPTDDPSAQPGSTGLVILARVGYEPGLAANDPADMANAAADSSAEQAPSLTLGPTLPTTVPATKPTTVAASRPTTGPSVQPRSISVAILSSAQTQLVPSAAMKDVTDRTRRGDARAVLLTDRTGHQKVQVYVPPEAVSELMKSPPGRGDDDEIRFFVQVMGITPNTEFFGDAKPVTLLVPPAGPGAPVRAIDPPPDPRINAPVLPIFRARATGSPEQQVRGGPRGLAPVAVYRFSKVSPPAVRDGQATFIVKTRIERSGTDEDQEDEPTKLSISVADRSGGNESAPIFVQPESNRAAYFQVPAQLVSDPNFEVRVRCESAGQYINLARSSVELVSTEEPFILNLAKSLLIMWLLSTLVIIISIFCSTFLSWPIAIVLTLIMLLSRWGVGQLSDALQPGIGNVVVTDMFGVRANPGVARTVSTAVERLSWALNNLARVLPDISQFSSIEDLEHGLSIPRERVEGALLVLLLFGLPLTTAAYVVLRLKEVAP